MKILALHLAILVHLAVADDCGVTSDPDVQYFDIRLPSMKVPPERTYYVCQRFKVPDSDTFHAIAFEPLINNHHVMHHLLVFGCDFDVTNTTPHECTPADGECRSWLAQWTLGVEGKICMPENTGVRFGKDSYRYMSLQVHWNNEEFSENYTDNSGMRIYYTTKLRNFDIGNVQIGQQDLEIPPNSLHNETGSCSETCTASLLPHPVHLVRTYIHMHYLGLKGLLEVLRDGDVFRRIAFDEDYNYQISPIHVHDPPIEILPGDEVRLTCTFDSQTGNRYRNHTLYFGEGSEAEMCYAFVTYYPNVPEFDQCIQFDKYDINCLVPDRPFMGGCNFAEFKDDLENTLLGKVKQSCKTQSLCGHECTKNLHNILDHPCMKDRLGSYSRRMILAGIPAWKEVSDILSQFKRRCIPYNV